jgi:hypothetical protein
MACALFGLEPPLPSPLLPPAFFLNMFVCTQFQPYTRQSPRYQCQRTQSVPAPRDGTDTPIQKSFQEGAKIGFGERVHEVAVGVHVVETDPRAEDLVYHDHPDIEDEEVEVPQPDPKQTHELHARPRPFQ